MQKEKMEAEQVGLEYDELIMDVTEKVYMDHTYNMAWIDLKIKIDFTFEDLNLDSIMSIEYIILLLTTKMNCLVTTLYATSAIHVMSIEYNSQTRTMLDFHFSVLNVRDGLTCP